MVAPFICILPTLSLLIAVNWHLPSILLLINKLNQVTVCYTEGSLHRYTAIERHPVHQHTQSLLLLW